MAVTYQVPLEAAMRRQPSSSGPSASLQVLTEPSSSSGSTRMPASMASLSASATTVVRHDSELGDFEDSLADDDAESRAFREAEADGRATESVASLDEVPFSFVIHDPQASLFFFEHLSQHGAKIDLLMFWMSVEEYKQSVGNVRSLTSQAQKLWERYLASDPNVLDLVEANSVANSVSLYSRDADLKRIRKVVEKESPVLDLFSSAQHFVEGELRRLYREGFRESSSFRALLAQLRDSRKLSLGQVLDSEKYSPFFARYIQKNLRGHFGNYLFLVEATDGYRARAHARDTPQQPRLATFSSTGSSPAMRSAQTAPAPGSTEFATVSGPQGTALMARSGTISTPPTTRPKSLAIRTQSQGSDAITRRPVSAPKEGLQPVDSSRIMRQRSEQSGAAFDFEDRPSSAPRSGPLAQREHVRQTSIMDMLPVGAAPTSAALELRMERQFLLELLEVAYSILDRYLSRSSSLEATLVSDKSKRFAAQQLEEISSELGGSTGKLASVSSFASISSNRAILDQLAQRLSNVFIMSQQDVIKWMRETVFPAFQQSEGYAALLALVEEETAEAHRTRKRINTILHGRIYSERLLVLRLPPRPVSDEKAAKLSDPSSSIIHHNSNPRLRVSKSRIARHGAGMLDSSGSLKNFLRSHSLGNLQSFGQKQQDHESSHATFSRTASISKFRQDRDGVSKSRRRMSSFLWNGVHAGEEDVPVISGVVKLTCDLLANERLLEANPLVCDCDCHFSCSDANCTCSCLVPTLSFRGGGLLFRSRTEFTLDPNHRIFSASGGHSAKSEDVSGYRGRSPTVEDEDDTEEETEGYDEEASDANSSPSAPSNQQSGSNPHFKGIESLENLSGLPPDLHAYMLPLGLSVRIIDLEHADATANEKLKVNLWLRPTTDPENLGGFIQPAPRPRRSFTRITIREVIGEETLVLTAADRQTEICYVREQRMSPAERKEWIAGVREQVMEMTPPPVVHPMVMPCRLHRRPERTSKTRFWYGAVHTAYRLIQVDCPLASKRDAEESNLDEEEENLKNLDSTNDEAEVTTTDDGYHEIVVRLAKHARYGLGMNLALTRAGFVELESFITRLDGNVCPAARCGALQIGDILISVNDRAVSNRLFSDVIDQVVRASSPIKFTFVRGYTHKIERCLSCGKTKCEPTFAFVPESVALLSYGRPLYQQLRRSIDEVLPHVSEASIDIEDLTRTLKKLNAYMRHEISHGPSLSLTPGPARPYFPFKQLFKFIRKEHVADVLASLLLNRPLLLLSDSMSALVFVAEALRSMLWPFVWKHPFNPALPIPLCRAFAERRAQKMEEIEALRNDKASSRQFRYMSSPFFFGICTRGMHARDSYLGEFVGYDDIRNYMMYEHDNLRPMDRFLAVRSLEPLLLDGTLLLDIDSDLLDIPKPSQSDLQNLADQQQAQSNAGRSLDPLSPSNNTDWALDRDRRLALTRFSHPLFRLDDTVVSRRARTSSVSSATSTLSMGSPPVAQETMIPSFPEGLRDKLLEEWAAIPDEHASLFAYHEKLMHVHAKLLHNYRAYCLTHDLDLYDDSEVEDSRYEVDEGEVPNNIILSFNVRAFLSKCMRLHRPYLSVFLRTKSFASFLTESTYTGSDVLERFSEYARGSSSLEDVDLRLRAARSRSGSQPSGAQGRRSSLTVLHEEPNIPLVDTADLSAMLPPPPLVPKVQSSDDADVIVASANESPRGPYGTSMDGGEEDNDDIYDEEDDEEFEEDDEEDEVSDENDQEDADRAAFIKENEEVENNYVEAEDESDNEDAASVPSRDEGRDDVNKSDPTASTNEKRLDPENILEDVELAGASSASNTGKPLANADSDFDGEEEEAEASDHNGYVEDFGEGLNKEDSTKAKSKAMELGDKHDEVSDDEDEDAEDKGDAHAGRIEDFGEGIKTKSSKAPETTASAARQNASDASDDDHESTNGVVDEL